MPCSEGYTKTRLMPPCSSVPVPQRPSRSMTSVIRESVGADVLLRMVGLEEIHRARRIGLRIVGVDRLQHQLVDGIDITRGE